MPANPKYLTKNPWQQFAKLSAGILGGYIVTALLHMCLPLWLPNPKAVLVTSIFTFFIVWCGLLIIPYLFKNGWKVWLLYLAMSMVLFGAFYLGSLENPLI